MMDSSAAAPTVPMRNTLRPTGVQLRRSPSPKTPTHSRPIPSSSNGASYTPASPEVISSLISSLSAISSPAESHFENLPHVDDNGEFLPGNGYELSRSGPSHGGSVNSRKRVPRQHGFGMDYGAYNNPSNEEPSPFQVGDAAIPPVIRMARPPTHPKPLPQSHEGSLRSLKLRRSQTSLRSDLDNQINPIKISIEPGPRSSSASVASADSIKKGKQGRTGDGVKGLIRRRSSSSLLHADSHTTETWGSNTGLRHSTSGRDLSKETIREAIAEGPSASPSTTREDPKAALQLRIGDSSASLNAPSSNGTSPETPTSTSNGHIIPSRQSSLRHTTHGSPATKHKSPRHNRFSSGGRDVRVDKDLTEEGTEVDSKDDPVTRRIQELRAKMQKGSDESEQISQARHNGKSPKSMPGPREIQSNTRDSKHSGNRISRSTSDKSNHDTNTENGITADLDEELAAPSPVVSNVNSKRNSFPLNTPLRNIRSPSLGGSLNSDGAGHSRRASESLVREDTTIDARKASKRLSPPGRISFGNEERDSVADSVDDDVDRFLNASRLTQKIAHPQTGRSIAFSEVGDPKGFAIICCVGMGLTRYLTAFYDELASTLKLRLITLDRPGVGESEPCLDGSGTPLSWPDDVAIVCNYLRINTFSILAHSAGAIYALATALRMPQHIRGRVHLMAPWIPPSQMATFGPHPDPLPSNSIPYSQKFLRAIPTSFLRAANSSFMTATSASITNRLPKSPRRAKRRSTYAADSVQANGATSGDENGMKRPTSSEKFQGGDQSKMMNGQNVEKSRRSIDPKDDEERRADYNERLTYAIWEASTTNANPAVDLVACLERRQSIGFRYVDIVRAVVIHHGSRDTRVPVENAKWLGRSMKRCEVRVLEGEGHGLMASASVMGNVLTEMAKEWEDWYTITQGKRESRLRRDSHWT